MVRGENIRVSQVISYSLHGACYLSITARCTLRCTFCPKMQGSLVVQQYDLRMDHEPTVDEVVAAVGDPRAFTEIVFCGFGEPTQRLDVLLAVATRLKALAPDVRIRVNTDGLASLVHGRDVTPELTGRIDALSISLNAQDATVYERHCRPKLAGAHAAVIDFARRARLTVPEVTVTAIDGLDGVDIAACERIAHDLGVAFRRRSLDVVG